MEDIKKAIEEIRPTLQADGGDIELVDFKEGAVMVRIRGACCHCPAISSTLYEGVERFLKERFPSVERLEVVP